MSNPFNRSKMKLAVPTIELEELSYDGSSNRYLCRVRVNGGLSAVSRIAQGYKIGNVVQFGGRSMVVTDTCVSHGADHNQIAKTILEFHAIDVAQIAAGLQEPPADNPKAIMRSASTGKMTDGAKAVQVPKFGPTARKLIL